MIKLLQMSDGQPHPSVSGPLVDMPYYERDWTWRANDIKIQATCSRLALTVPIFVRSGAPRAPHFIVWDWKTGVKYVVSSDQVRIRTSINRSFCRTSCVVRSPLNSLMSAGYLGCQMKWALTGGGR